MCQYTDIKNRLMNVPLFTFEDAELIIGCMIDDLAEAPDDLYSAADIVKVAEACVASIIHDRTVEMMPE